MLGTFAGALDARKIDAKQGRLTAAVRGEIETDDGVLIIRRVHVQFQLKAPESVRETVDRVHSLYKESCPVYRTLRPAMDITSACELLAETGA